MPKKQTVAFRALLASRTNSLTISYFHGSAKTRHNHIKEARRFVKTVRKLGYGVQRWKNITNKHVQQAVDKWKEEGLQTATIKEYLSGVRTVCQLYGNNRIAT
ncbi:MAG: phage integrase N-terminal domain-containing protein, partial [Desulfobacterales bacterium]